MEVLNVKEFAKQNNQFNSILNPILSQFSYDNTFVFPGFCDVHVHFREPGFFYKETIKSGSQSGARGGFTTVFTMPNLNPVPDSLKNLQIQLDAIKKDGVIEILPYASITKGQQGQELSDFEDLAPLVAGFSDDGKGVQSREMMKSAMLKAKALNKIIVAHCEDNSLLDGGYIHKGDYALKNGHKGISSESEYMQIARDVELLKETGAKYHVCHVSTKESVEIIRNAKKQGVDITCETAPHYLVFNDSMLKDEGRFKMNPPIRAEEDRLALIEGIKDGTIDMIATDHAPHSEEEKSKGLKGSLMGIVGLETCFPVLYTNLVKTGVITLQKLIELLCYNPRKRFGIKEQGFTVWNLDESYNIDSSKFLTKGRSTPFENHKVFGKCLLTVCNNKIAYKE
ncbi:MAG: dihydroorotase [Clostridia bacterium]|nr:dihydroorotase [Clostridia bacterium]